jgi:hypothetical protein
MMVALVAATSTSFVSCKDTNEDVRIEQAAEIAALQGRLTELENQYGDLDKRVTALRDDVIALQNGLSYTQAEVNNLEQRCDQLESWLKDTFAKLVTSVEINATWNNMTGMVAIPGVKANMLIANYGVAGKAGKFPVEGKLVNEKEQLGWSEGTKFGYSEEQPTYAGTIYATVNKYLNGDFVLAKDKFGAQLVKTSGDNIDDYVTIALGNEGKPTDKDLDWGWTRADNNIYEFEIGIKGNPEDLGFNILKIEGLKDDIKTIFNNRQHTTAAEFAQAVAKLYYTAIQGGAGSNLPMYALRLGWMDGNQVKEYKAAYDIYNGATNESKTDTLRWTKKEFMNEAKHYVQSNADLMLATIKPFAFTTKDVPATITPKVQMTLDQAEKIFNRAVASVNSVVQRAIFGIKGGTDYANYDLTKMMVTPITKQANANPNLKAGTAPAAADWKPNQIYYVEGAAAPYYIYTLGTVPTTVAPAAGADWPAANGTMDDALGQGKYIVLNGYFAEYLSTQANEFNRAVELVMEAQTYATNGGLWNKFEDKVLNYSVKLDKWIANNFNHALQPTLFAIHGVKKGTKILNTIDTKNAKLNRVSGIKESPMGASAGDIVILKPTSYTVETFCPIKAKFVTVTEVSDGKETKTLTPAEAEALSVDIDNGAKLGHVSTSYIDQYAFAPEKGKKYTILYEAVDYFGNTFSKEYYIVGE